MDADWQAEVIKRLAKAKERQGKQRERLVNLSKQTRAKEEEVVQLMVEVEGKQVRIHVKSAVTLYNTICPSHILSTVVMYVA